jgi:hypothetical protein
MDCGSFLMRYLISQMTAWSDADPFVSTSFVIGFREYNGFWRTRGGGNRLDERNNAFVSQIIFFARASPSR